MLALIINVFEGEEHLHKLLNIYPYIDVCIAVTQKVSYNGEYYDEGHNMAKGLYPLINKVVEFVPDLSLSPRQNETIKRNLGIKTALELGATYFLDCDSDEVFEPKQFQKAKKNVIEGGYDSSACHFRTYYYSKDYVVDPPEIHYVPFIHRLTPQTMTGSTFYPVSYVDETRKISPANNIYVFEREELEMHHYSLVRENMGLKLRNSSAQLKDVPKLLRDFNSFPKKLIFHEGVKRI